MKNKTLSILKAQHEKTGGHCGVYRGDIMQQLGLGRDEVNKLLNELYIDGKTTVHEGIKSDKLIKLKVCDHK